MGYPYLAKVYAGWAGSLVVTSGSLSTTVAPRYRESWASFWARVVTDCYIEQGLTLTVEMIAEDTARVTGSTTFDMTFSGGLGAATDFDSGPYSGATSYQSDANWPDEVLTVEQLVCGADISVAAGRLASDGAIGAAGPAIGEPVDLRVVCSPAFGWGFETWVSAVYDVAYDSRVFVRARIDGWSRRPVGKLRSMRVTLDAQAQAVSE